MSKDTEWYNEQAEKLDEYHRLFYNHREKAFLLSKSSHFSSEQLRLISGLSPYTTEDIKKNFYSQAAAITLLSISNIYKIRDENMRDFYINDRNMFLSYPASINECFKKESNNYYWNKFYNS